MTNSQATARCLVMLYIVTLSACGGGGSGGGDGGSTPGPTGTIQLEAISFDGTEGTIVNIAVNRSGGSSGAASVDYAITDGTAVAGSDYSAIGNALSGTITFADQSSGNQTIGIAITDDTLVEAPESLTLTLSNATGATLGANSSATINIIDNDIAVLPITSDNAQAITVDVLEAIISTIDLVDILDLIGIPAIVGTNSDLTKLRARDTFTDNVPCETGEATVTWNDLDNNIMMSTGDTFEVLFNMCFFADSGVTLDGATSLTNLTVAGDPVNQIAPWRLATTFGFDSLSATDSAGVAVIDGSLDLDLSSDDNVLVSLFIGTDSLTAQQSGITETLTNYVVTQTIDLNTLTQVVSIDGTFNSSSLGGSVTFETLQDFIVIDDDNPSAGQMLISDSNSSVLVTVLDNINVQLEIDLDLDGMIDETIVVPWSGLGID